MWGFKETWIGPGPGPIGLTVCGPIYNYSYIIKIMNEEFKF